MFQRNMKDVIGGLALLLVGVVFFVDAFQYKIGTASQMGPGFYPMLIAAIIILLSLVIIVSGVVRAGDGLPQISFRPMIAVVAAIAVFALSMQQLGLLPAILLAVCISSCGDARARPLTALGTSAVLALGGWLIFSVGLDLPLPLIRGLI